MTNSTEEKFNTIEQQDNVLYLVIDKPITKDGYALNFMPKAKNIVAQHGSIKILMHYKEYKGWEKDAAQMDLNTFAEHGSSVDKFALINPPKKEILAKKILSPLIRGELKIFDESDLDGAFEWINNE